MGAADARRQCAHRPAHRGNPGAAHFHAGALSADTLLSEFVVENRIREWRLVRGVTQEQLAKLCDVTRQTIIALEGGKYSPSLELAFRLAHSLGRTLEEIFQYVEKK